MSEAQELYAKLVQARGDPPVLGGVLLSEVLGTGGMGTVFKGLHLRLSIPVAVKVMLQSPQSAQTPLLGEAHASAHVNHPNVVRIYDLGKEGDIFYMIQEYVEGRTADEIVCEARDGKLLSEQAVLSLGCDIARGLAAMHAEGYLHHDVKPANIIVSSKDGVAKLLDLGLAQRWAQVPNDPAKTVEFEGTPGYISPERIASMAVGPASDIYGLGVSLYEILTGKFAYEPASPTVVLTQQLTNEATDIRTLRPQISLTTARIVHKCMKIDPDERFADANTLLNELAKALQALEPQHAAMPPSDAASAMPEAPPASIVCVDDDLQIGAFITDILEDAGFRVRYYADPRAAVSGILKDPPDVVITDVCMPDMTGHDVCAAIRATPIVSEVPVVFLTSDEDLESVGLAMQMGATDYLLKPVNPADLLARVKCLARMAAARREFEALDTHYGMYRNRLKALVTKGAPQ